MKDLQKYKNIIYNNIMIKLIQLDDILGIGTFKKIYKGYDYDLGREVAWCEMNLVQGNIEDNENITNISLIKENIENIKKLKHPNLLDYIAIWYKENNNNNKAVIITELLQGGNLREYRKYQKRLKVKLVKKWIKQLLSALDYLHSNNFIHHDIKSQNILVDRITGNLKLGDLICAEKLGEKGYFTKYIGTEEFMAPEVKEGKYTFKADIYSLGLTIIQFITMEKPYKEYNRKNSLYLAKKRGEYPLSFQEIKNEEIKNFISLCLREEKTRPSCKELLQNKWLNDKNSSDNNSFIELDTNLRMIDKSKSYTQLENLNKNYFNGSNSSLININKKLSTAYMRPIYSLDISKLNSNDIKKINKNNMNQIQLKSFKGKKNFKKESIAKIKSLFNLNNSNENKIKEDRENFSDRGSCKHLDEIIGVGQNFIEEINNDGLINIYLYIIENEEKLFFVIREREEKNENNILGIKIIVSKKILKNQKLIGKVREIKFYDLKEKDIFDLILSELKNLFELNEKNEFLIRTKIIEKVNKLIKEKKIRNLKEKINKIIRNFELLLNNDEFDYMEYLINSDNFDEIKLPKEIGDKLRFYKQKKFKIENLFCLHNMSFNDECEKHVNHINRENLTIKLFDNDNI